MASRTQNRWRQAAGGVAILIGVVAWAGSGGDVGSGPEQAAGVIGAAAGRPAIGSPPVSAPEGGPSAHRATSAEAAVLGAGAAGTAGLRAHLDPQTGRLLPGRPPGTPPLALLPEDLERLRTDHFDLIEEPLPEGGFAVNLRGRFRSALVATVTRDGRVETRCERDGSAPASEEDGHDH